MRITHALATALVMGGIAAPSAAADWRLAAHRDGAVFVDRQHRGSGGRCVPLLTIYRRARKVRQRQGKRRGDCSITATRRERNSEGGGRDGETTKPSGRSPRTASRRRPIAASP